jgi:hypothetical protein
MKIKIEIDTDNSAFEGGNLVPEVGRILLGAASWIGRPARGRGVARRGLTDINGNTVGMVEVLP